MINVKLGWILSYLKDGESGVMCTFESLPSFDTILDFIEIELEEENSASRNIRYSDRYNPFICFHRTLCKGETWSKYPDFYISYKLSTLKMVRN